MLVERVTLLNKLGLHARPASRLVKIAAQYKETTVEVGYGAEIINAKSILGVMMLAAGPGTELEIRVDGPEEKECLAELVDLVNKKFFEDE